MNSSFSACKAGSITCTGARLEMAIRFEVRVRWFIESWRFLQHGSAITLKVAFCSLGADEQGADSFKTSCSPVFPGRGFVVGLAATMGSFK